MALRKRTGLERAAFADLLGVERTTIWRWETGSRKIDRFTEEAIKRLVERLINETA
jgi:DNA-binding transcriptional regulator YiaG